MIKKLLIAVLALSTFAACSDKKSAFNYNQDFVKKEQELVPEITKTENNVENYLAKQQYDSISVAGAKMEKLIDDQLQKIIAEPAPKVKGGDEFKQSCVKYFSFMKSMYTGYKDFGAAKTDDARQAEMTKLQNIVAEKTTVLADIKAAQIKFASANGFRMENE